MAKLKAKDEKLDFLHLPIIGKDYGWADVQKYGCQLLFVADL